jgi:hypothetical protein
MPYRICCRNGWFIAQTTMYLYCLTIRLTKEEAQKFTIFKNKADIILILKLKHTWFYQNHEQMRCFGSQWRRRHLPKHWINLLLPFSHLMSIKIIGQVSRTEFHHSVHLPNKPNLFDEFTFEERKKIEKKILMHYTSNLHR